MAKMIPQLIDFRIYMKDTDAKQKVHKASAYVDDLKDRLRTKAKQKVAKLPWIGSDFEFRLGEVTLWCGQNGHGKALHIDTKIPTPTGWSTMADLNVGDQVFDENGLPCNVVATTEVMIGRPCYRVEFDDGSVIIADEQHQWLTDCSRSRHSARTTRDRLAGPAPMRKGADQSHKRILPKIRTTKEISETLLVSGKTYHGTTNHSIKNCKPLVMPEIDLPIDPYCLGAWLGDGTSRSAQLTSNDQFIIDEFSKVGVIVTKYVAKYQYGLTGGFLKGLKQCNLLQNKHVPKVYFRASFEQRLALIQGLMDTDGSVTSYGRCEFTATNRILAEDFLELCLSCGIKAKMIEGVAKLYGKDCGPKYRTTFTTDLPVFRLPRKLQYIKQKLSPVTQNRYIVACEKISSVPVKCIEVDSPSHLYLASEGFIPTHNSALTSQVALSLLGQQEKVCIASFEMKPEVTLQRMARMWVGINPFSSEFQSEEGLKALDDLYEQFGEWTDTGLWMYDQTGTADADSVLGMTKYCAKELGVTHVFIDNLAKCIASEDDYNGQKRFVDQLTAIARDHKIHIHLVHHLKKPENEYKMPDKHDTKGSGAITDLVDNVMLVFRNKLKEEDRKQNGNFAKSKADPDQFLLCRKQRNYEGDEEGEPTLKLWFSRDSQQYINVEGERPMAFWNPWPHTPT